jgi:hypothetical protein
MQEDWTSRVGFTAGLVTGWGVCSGAKGSITGRGAGSGGEYCTGSGRGSSGGIAKEEILASGIGGNS